MTGKQVSFQFIDQIVAMPYVSGRTGLPADQADKLYCTDAQVVDLPTQSNVPELSVGFPDVQYADSWTVPLRLGLPNYQKWKDSCLYSDSECDLFRNGSRRWSLSEACYS